MGRKKIFMDQVLNEDKCGPETTGLPFSLPAVIDTGEYSFPGPRKSGMEWPLLPTTFLSPHPRNRGRKQCCQSVLGATDDESMSAKADARTDLIFMTKSS